MIACICGFETLTEDELTSHFVECHRQSYGLDSCPAEMPVDRDREDTSISLVSSRQ